MAIFLEQTNVTIRVNTGIDLTTATTALIKYRKPITFAEGSFTATIVDALEGIIEYQVTSTADLDTPGNWEIFAHITFADSSVSMGEIDIMTIERNWGQIAP